MKTIISLLAVLAMAVVCTKTGEKAVLTRVRLLKLVINGDPHKPVNTKDPQSPA
jgi:hypothetical protein